ncbi:hypothetical protein ACEPPN_012203 [Leptodophora sp. 'Broadleaf-Isolate-01']
MAETTKNPSSVSLYSPLASENEIRLLCLLSGVGEDPIECTLQHANLEHNPNYEALSYVWGSPTSSESIEISGKEYFIRENLSSALQHLRHPQNARLFWIDALCINQEDVSERNDQVHQMGRIYRSAVKVIVWLGPSDSSTVEAMRYFLKTRNRAKMRKSFGESLGKSPLSERPTANQNGQLQHITSLCLREYWSRLWIIQEVILAREILVQCGRDTCSWNDLTMFFQQVNEHLGMSWVPWEIAISERERILDEIRGTTLARLIREREEFKTKITKNPALGTDFRPLLDLCATYGDAICHDKRDKIFGLHSFARRCCIDAVPVDYSLSFARVACLLIQHHTQEHSVHKEVQIVADVHLFHHKLGITFTDCQQAISDLHQSSPDWAVSLERHGSNAIGSIRGRISYTSPPLNQGVSQRRLEAPNLSGALIEQLKFLNPNHTEWYDRRPRQCTRQLDLIYSITDCLQPVTHPLIARPQLPTPNKRKSKVAKVLHKLPFMRTSKSPIDPTESIDTDFSYIHVKAEEAVYGAPAESFRLAIEEAGLVMLVPKCVKIDDLICQFQGSNTLVIIREDRNDSSRTRSYIIGRAVNLLACSPTAASDICGQDQDYLKPPYVNVPLDGPTLQKLTCASTTPDPWMAHTGNNSL